MLKIKSFLHTYWENDIAVNDFIRKIYADGGEVIDIKLCDRQGKFSFITIVYKEKKDEI